VRDHREQLRPAFVSGSQIPEFEDGNTKPDRNLFLEEIHSRRLFKASFKQTGGHWTEMRSVTGGGVSPGSCCPPPPPPIIMLHSPESCPELCQAIDCYALWSSQLDKPRGLKVTHEAKEFQGSSPPGV
jgi:hypothetical protein